MQQPRYYHMIAKAVISNAKGIISAIDYYIAKADEELEQTLSEEGFAEPGETVEQITTLQDKIADILHSQRDELLMALAAASGWKEAKKKVFQMMENDDIAEQIEEAAADMLDIEVPQLATEYMKITEADLVVDTLRQRTSNWMASWSSELGRLMKINTHKQLTDLIQNAIDNGESIEKLTRKIMDGGWRTEYYQARRVALTEVLRAHSVAHEEAIQQSPATDRKEWVHTGAHKNEPRPNHVDMSGQIVPKEQPFTLVGRNGITYYPMYPIDPILPASESVNCHCTHRGVTNDSILGMPYEERKKLQQQFIKNDDAEYAEDSKPKYDYEASRIDRKQIASAEYRNRYNALPENKKIQRKVAANAKKMLRHRSGTQYEDLAFIDSKTGAVMLRDDYNVSRQVNPSKAMKKMVKDAEDYTIISIHNHPGSSVPSLDDIKSAKARKYKYGIVACHDGGIYKYQISGEFNEVIADGGLDLLEQVKYNKNEQERSSLMNRALKILRDGGVSMEVL